MALIGSVSGSVSGSFVSTGSFGEVHVVDRIGIGTTNPDTTIHVKGSSFPVGVIERTAGSDTTGAFSGLRLKTTTTGNMADGFGHEIQLHNE